MLGPRGTARTNRFVLTFGLLVTASCSAPNATRYAGVGMNPEHPESEAEVRFTFFSRTDSGFSGVVEVGAPLTGTGATYAWHEDTELRIISVNAEDDTVLWYSKQTEGDIGGRFEVVGGRREGESGTWRATLTRGPPLSPATLRMPWKVPMPPVLSFWPLLVLTLVLVRATPWVRRTPPRSSAPFEPGEAGQRVRLGGWLKTFVVLQIGATLFVLYRLLSAWENYVDGIGFAAALRGMESLLIAETAVSVVTPVFTVLGIGLTLRRSSYAPRYWFAFFTVSLVYTAADNFLASSLQADIARVTGEDISTASDFTSELSRMVVSLVANGVWMAYWARSQRVRQTFGAAAFDTAWRTPTPLVVLLTPERRKVMQRRWIAGFTLGFVAVVISLWYLARRQTIVPYLLPEGTRIRDHVAGRWSWTTEKPMCGDDAHTIAFSDSGRVMIISTTSLTTAGTVTEYEIESTTQSTIRGAIRGETRLTDAGEPVVWDLVLVAEDAYRWRRTDWAERNGTPIVKRCPPPPASR